MARLNLQERWIDARLALVASRSFAALEALDRSEVRPPMRDLGGDGLRELEWAPGHLGKIAGCSLRVRLRAAARDEIGRAVEGADAILIALDGDASARAEDEATLEAVRAALARAGRVPDEVPLEVILRTSDEGAPLASARDGASAPRVCERLDTLEGLVDVLDDAGRLVLQAVRDQSKGKAPPPPAPPEPAAPPLATAPSPALRDAIVDALGAELRALEARLTQTFAGALEARTREDSARLEALERRLSDAEDRARVLEEQRRAALADQAHAAISLGAKLDDLARRHDGGAAALAELGRRIVEVVDEIVELRARVAQALTALEERKRAVGLW